MRYIALIIPLVILLTACGGATDSGQAPAPVSEPTQVEEPAEEPAPAPEEVLQEAVNQGIKKIGRQTNEQEERIINVMIIPNVNSEGRYNVLLHLHADGALSRNGFRTGILSDTLRVLDVVKESEAFEFVQDVSFFWYMGDVVAAKLTLPRSSLEQIDTSNRLEALSLPEYAETYLENF